MAKRKSKKLGRSKFAPARRSAPGTVPGTILIDPSQPKPIISVIAYNAERFEEHTVEHVRDIKPFLDAFPVTWVNVDGLGSDSVIREFGEIFGLHPLALEDTVNLHQRPKVEDYGDLLYVVVKMADVGERFDTEQMSLFLGKNFVISFQERPGDCFEPVRERIRQARGRVRISGPDFVAYGIIDSIVDEYFPVIEAYGETLEALEERVLAKPDHGTVTQLHELRHDLLIMQRAVRPLRETVKDLMHAGDGLITETTEVYLRDCYDHTIQLAEFLEAYREVGTSLMDVYLSSVSLRANEVMKLLTLIATIFIPLTFIAGIYGMNFDPDKSPLNMPELRWYWGYPFALGLMAATAIAFLVYFRVKGWLGGKSSVLATPILPVSLGHRSSIEDTGSANGKRSASS